MKDERHSPAVTHCVNTSSAEARRLFARETTTELFKRPGQRQLAECPGADRFIGRRIGQLILICAAATARKLSLAPAATHNGIVGAR